MWLVMDYVTRKSLIEWMKMFMMLLHVVVNVMKKRGVKQNVDQEVMNGVCEPL